ncbi:hypothetical protein PHIM7_268 [Sinorhizobium phage phiM7]|uniref:Uncharacterized protein n=1 Tax=Sinorhizobium phage phiM7 TaxID=1647403 RepID=A0A0F6SIP5_9CAUD|nr:hypothetical protein FDH46_gp210 [Sinorhizobium phage phiM7]AKF12813.1 hypothetical protein PHIM7_268 [Sinorhizobium phage phiM7]AKF13173.1 hypothetical protein PHIM19_268 [Sinorhizobium phage phiM19]
MSADWIEHDGLQFPGIDPKTLVLVQFRDEAETDTNPRPAIYWGPCWTLIDRTSPTSSMNRHCIARYQIVEGFIE